ncbi:MAG: DUF2207 domain-containing protein [Propionibacteriaceae bacterium]|nr:DUF2207 domain-containing protein [Propionibacteriaceae bacterium]
MIWPALLAILTVVTLVARIVLVRREQDALGNETVAVAFAPPRAVTPGLSAALRREVPDSALVPAEILDLAVRGIWQVGVQGEGNDKVWFVQRDGTTEPELPEVPLAVYRAVFPPGSPLTRVELGPDRGRTIALQGAIADAYGVVQARGWVEYGSSQRLLATGWAGLALAVVGFVTLTGGVPTAGLPLLAVTILGGLATQFIKPKPWRLTAEGRRINDELDGLKLYMTMAETDRLKVLQAPDTAERVPALAGPDGTDKGEIAKLHERLLPYAVLFGILPQWSEVVKHDYAEAEYAPGWLALDVAADIMLWSTFLNMGGFDALGDLGDFGSDVGDATGMGELEGGDLGGGDLGGGEGGDGGGFFDGGGDGGGFDFDFDF